MVKSATVQHHHVLSIAAPHRPHLHPRDPQHYALGDLGSGRAKDPPGAPPGPMDRGMEGGTCRDVPGCGRSVLGVRPSPTFPRSGNPPGVRGWAGGAAAKPSCSSPTPGRGILCGTPIPRVPHAPAPGTRSNLVPEGPQPVLHPTWMLWSIIRYQNNASPRPLSASRRC